MVVSDLHDPCVSLVHPSATDTLYAGVIEGMNSEYGGVSRRGNISFDRTVDGRNLTIDLLRSGIRDVGQARRERTLVGELCEPWGWD